MEGKQALSQERRQENQLLMKNLPLRKSPRTSGGAGNGEFVRRKE
jgi:hypothetical protein